MSSFQNGYALLIGVDENQVSHLALPVVGKDVEALGHVLVHPDRCAYPPAHVSVVRGAEASREGVLGGLQRFAEQVAADPTGNSTAVLYFSGHGARLPDGSYYLIPYDVRRPVETWAIQAEAFRAAVEDIEAARLLVVLDCCHAGGMGVKDGLLEAEVEESPLSALSKRRAESHAADKSVSAVAALAQGQGRAVLSSSSGAESSYVRNDGRMSLFTYHLIEALTGHAGEGREVLVTDVMSYVARRVPESAEAQHKASQTPVHEFSGEAFPVALLLGGKGVAAGALAPDPVRDAPGPIVDTGGGAYVGRDVNTGGGPFVGRDQIIYGDNVGGNKYSGDHVRGDKTVFHGAVRAENLSTGSHSPITQHRGVSGAELAAAVSAFADAVESSQGFAAQKEVAGPVLEEVKRELKRGERRDDTRLSQLLGGLVSLVPDAVKAVVSAFASPVLGALAGPATQRIIDRLQEESPG